MKNLKGNEVSQIVTKIYNHRAITDRNLKLPVDVFAFSSDEGVDFSLPQDACKFRRQLLDKGFSVARKNQKGIGINYRLIKEKTATVIKVGVAFVLYRNGQLL